MSHLKVKLQAANTREFLFEFSNEIIAVRPIVAATPEI